MACVVLREGSDEEMGGDEADSSENETKAYPLERFWRPYFNTQRQKFWCQMREKNIRKTSKFCPNGLPFSEKTTTKDGQMSSHLTLFPLSLTVGVTSQNFTRVSFARAKSPCFRRF